MSVKIRLSLTGRSHQISHRLVAQDTRSKRDGKFLEILGFVNPFQKENAIKINKDRIKYYLSKGATFTPSAKFVFENGKLPPKTKKVKAKPEVEEKAPEASKAQDTEAQTAQPQEQKPAEAKLETAPQTTDSDQTTSDQPDQPEKPAEAGNQQS